MRAALCVQLVDLCDLVLDGYSKQIGSIGEGDRARAKAVNRAYERDRKEMILALGKAYFSFSSLT